MTPSPLAPGYPLPCPACNSPLVTPRQLRHTAGMFQVSREIEFCYGHRLLNYAGKCRYLHGHNGRLVVTVESEHLDTTGMVHDFSDIKRCVAGWIENNLDHRMILHEADPAIPMLRQLGEPLYVMDANPTAENIARLIHKVARELGFPVVETQLWETPHCAAVYRGEAGNPHGQS